jgi:CRISPR-associated exonuclease Cas4
MAVPSAGEVEQFVYCAHNWWLARQGHSGSGQASERGVEEHKHKAEAQAGVEGRKREVRRAFSWSFRGILLASSATGATLAYVYRDELQHNLIFLTLGLVLTSAAAALLVLGILDERAYRSAQAEHGIVPGDLVETGLTGSGQPMVDKEWDVSGRPDYVVQGSRGIIPVEVKTGRTPKEPFPSHRLQLGCYLRLVEVTTGKAPEYGLLTYPEGNFRVDWNDALRAELKGTLDRMAQAKASGRADRDHDQPGRCRGCARREACDQRLA